MKYRLLWINYHSTERKSTNPQVTAQYTEMSENWYECEYTYYFDSDDDISAKQKATKFVKAIDEIQEVWSLYNTITKEVILTEEEQ